MIDLTVKYGLIRVCPTLGPLQGSLRRSLSFSHFFHFTLSFLQGRSTVLWRPSDGVFLRKVLFVFSFVQFFLFFNLVEKFLGGDSYVGRGLQYDLEHKVVVIQWEEKVVLEENIVVSKVKGLHSGSSQV